MSLKKYLSIAATLSVMLPIASMAASSAGDTLLVDQQNNLYVMSNADNAITQVTKTNGTAAKVSPTDLKTIKFKSNNSPGATTGGFCLIQDINGKEVDPCQSKPQPTSVDLPPATVSPSTNNMPHTTTGGMCQWQCISSTEYVECGHYVTGARAESYCKDFNGTGVGGGGAIARLFKDHKTDSQAHKSQPTSVDLLPATVSPSTNNMPHTTTGGMCQVNCISSTEYVACGHYITGARAKSYCQDFNGTGVGGGGAIVRLLKDDKADSQTK